MQHASGFDWAIASGASVRHAEQRAGACPRPSGTLVAVVEGHGSATEATASEQVAIATLREYAGSGALALVTRCHQALIGTSGIALGLALVDVEEDTLSWVAVGPVSGVIVRARAARKGAETLRRGEGVVGVHLPTLRGELLALAVGDQLVVAASGIRVALGDADGAGITPALARPLSPARLADRIVTEQSRPGDDALVLVGRYRGRRRVS